MLKFCLYCLVPALVQPASLGHAQSWLLLLLLLLPLLMLLVLLLLPVLQPASLGHRVGACHDYEPKP